MATITAQPGPAVEIATARTGNFDTDIIDRGALSGPAALLIDTTAGATPTVTANIQGSVDGAVWFNVAYSLVATPTSQVVTAITITTTVKTTYLVAGGYGYRYLKVAFSANTNITVNQVAVSVH